MVKIDRSKLVRQMNRDNLDCHYIYKSNPPIEVVVTTAEIARIDLPARAGLNKLYSAIDSIALKKLRELL